MLDSKHSIEMPALKGAVMEGRRRAGGRVLVALVFGCRWAWRDCGDGRIEAVARSVKMVSVKNCMKGRDVVFCAMVLW